MLWYGVFCQRQEGNSALGRPGSAWEKISDLKCKEKWDDQGIGKWGKLKEKSLWSAKQIPEVGNVGRQEQFTEFQSREWRENFMEKEQPEPRDHARAQEHRHPPAPHFCLSLLGTLGSSLPSRPWRF